MGILNQIFAIIFYIMLFCWIFFKIRNSILIKKKKCKEFYKDIKKELKNEKTSKYLFRIIISSIILFAIYLAIGLIAGCLAVFMAFITLGGAAYVDTGKDPSFFNNLWRFINNYFSLFNYIVYLITYILLIRGVYINVKVSKAMAKGPCQRGRGILTQN